MPSSSVCMFTEADEYAAALQQGPVQITVMQRGRFAAKLCTVHLHQVWIQRLSEELPRTSHVDTECRRAFFMFRTQPGPSVIRNGIELSATNIARLRCGHGYYLHTSGPTSHAGLSVALEDISCLGGPGVGQDLMPPKDDVNVTPLPEAMVKLQRLCASAEELAECAPAVLAHPEAAYGFEQALIEALTECLSGCEIREDRAALRQHSAIMRRFHRTLERYADQPLYVPELCREIGASERTLRTCCQEHLGMSPKHYLSLRRLHLVRRALRESSPRDATVTEIATRYGFWQFGRLAVEYRALFGEMPSTTLARSM